MSSSWQDSGLPQVTFSDIRQIICLFWPKFDKIRPKNYGENFLGQKRFIFGVKIFGFTILGVKKVPFLGSNFYKGNFLTFLPYLLKSWLFSLVY
jgi:hypothetical protein